MVVYHAIHPDFSKAFDDNGDEDEFDPNPDPTNPNGIFWIRIRVKFIFISIVIKKLLKNQDE